MKCTILDPKFLVFLLVFRILPLLSSVRLFVQIVEHHVALIKKQDFRDVMDKKINFSKNICFLLIFVVF